MSIKKIINTLREYPADLNQASKELNQRFIDLLESEYNQVSEQVTSPADIEFVFKNNMKNEKMTQDDLAKLTAMIPDPTQEAIHEFKFSVTPGIGASAALGWLKEQCEENLTLITNQGFIDKVIDFANEMGERLVTMFNKFLKPNQKEKGMSSHNILGSMTQYQSKYEILNEQIQTFDQTIEQYKNELKKNENDLQQDTLQKNLINVLTQKKEVIDRYLKANSSLNKLTHKKRLKNYKQMVSNLTSEIRRLESENVLLNNKQERSETLSKSQPKIDQQEQQFNLKVTR